MLRALRKILEAVLIENALDKRADFSSDKAIFCANIHVYLSKNQRSMTENTPFKRCDFLLGRLLNAVWRKKCRKTGGERL